MMHTIHPCSTANLSITVSAKVKICHHEFMLEVIFIFYCVFVACGSFIQLVIVTYTSARFLTDLCLGRADSLAFSLLAQPIRSCFD